MSYSGGQVAYGCEQLAKLGLTKLDWGNVSIKEFDSVYIKPSGFKCDEVRDFEVVEYNTTKNKIVSDHKLKPSVDLPMHLEIYKAIPEVKAIAHFHSEYATIWAQAGRDIPCLGTTHADVFGHEHVFCTPTPNKFENYEAELGKDAARWLINGEGKLISAVLLACHGAVVVSTKDVYDLLDKAVALEEVAKMAYKTRMLAKNLDCQGELFRDNRQEVYKFHYERKHGENKYYGQQD